MKYYLDCEFNGYRGALISLALVRDDGAELYLAIGNNAVNQIDDWVKSNVLPIVTTKGAYPHVVGLDAAPRMIEEFMRGDPLPTVIADWPDDIRYFCECLIIEPGVMINIPTDREKGDYDIQFVVSRVDAYPTELPGAVQHNALWDARALREKLVGSF